MTDDVKELNRQRAALRRLHPVYLCAAERFRLRREALVAKILWGDDDKELNFSPPKLMRAGCWAVDESGVVTEIEDDPDLPWFK